MLGIPWTEVSVFGAGFLTAVVVCLLVVNFMTGEKQVRFLIERMFSIEDDRFAQELSALLGPQFEGGNRVQSLFNGDEIFPPMLAAIREATRTITFETYIYWSGDIGRDFANALSGAARRNVSCHVLLDWIGSEKMDKSLIHEMLVAGVEIERFHPPKWSHLGQLNNRTHRKLLVVDGSIGFTGGVGIAPSWTGHAQDPDHWRDTHVRLDGPAVAQMQSVFLDNWIKVTGRVLHGEAYFPVLGPAGPSRVQMFSSSPDGGSDSMQLMYLFAITAAARTIDLSAAYFVPDVLTRQELLVAIGRGVRVRIIVPGAHIDSETVRSASRSEWGPLLQAGAMIAEYGPTMFHCKVMIVDGLLTALGSTNFDNRSFRLNDEATLNVLDRDFAAVQTAAFERDLALSEAISLERWERRPFTEKARDRVTALIRGQL